MDPIKRILCPIDFSETALHAFAFAERLAISLSAELVLLHVSDQEPGYTVAGQESSTHSAVQEQLDSIKTQHKTIPVRRILHSGPPGEVICWLAENQHCDLIVMGTHGREGLMHLLLGSVAEYVMRHARCPVLTTRLIPDKDVPLKEPLSLPVPAPRFM